MIQNVDDTLLHLLTTQMKTLGAVPPTADQIRFQPPDAKWRQHVGHLGSKKALNLYLVDIRENRKLRSNEVIREYRPGIGLVDEYPAPARADCHYLITAWSNVDEDVANPNYPPNPQNPQSPMYGRTGEEHQILHEVASILNEHQPLAPRSVFGGVFPAGFPDDLEDAALPTVLLPVEGFPKYAEFWGTMGTTHPWKPAVYLVVTVPLRVTHRSAGPPVHTIFSDYRPEFDQPGETLIDIGGTVLDGTTAVGGAWVRLETLTHDLVQSATSDALGHFRLMRVEPQQYWLRAGSGGVGDSERQIDVPSLTGEYDLHLT